MDEKVDSRRVGLFVMQPVAVVTSENRSDILVKSLKMLYDIG